MLSRVSMRTATVEAHTTAGGKPNVAPICGITEEQSPSGNPNAKAKGNVLGVSAQYIGGEGGEGGSGKGCAGVGDSTAVGSGGCCGGEGGDGSNSGKGGDDDAWSRMVTAGGEDTAVAQMGVGKLYIQKRPSQNKVASATVKLAKIISRMALEDGLTVLAISWRVPGSVACRFLIVIFTSLGSGLITPGRRRCLLISLANTSR